ncbi:CPBP family intramembrane glutamic endopeptidase [Leucobacter aridicollis]|uniref:CPBP family intramembrane glutamic endopeptidase n=1 Tax=Leucobacter aridicollis TaxID=283878 RepID=UPI002169B6BA|nr:type II CAAX endopeptidase family protein [Leucobacter aridicollis]MCS3426862.1 membrane protease YdiL (CAAX protease family) [Leucobacter aridicollis]
MSGTTRRHARDGRDPGGSREARVGLGLVAELCVVLAAPAFFVAELPWLGAGLFAAGLLGAVVADRRGGIRISPRTGDSAAPSLTRDLSLVALGLIIVRTIPLAAELDTLSMLRFTLALGGAVLVPYLVSRFVYGDRATGFPWRGEPPRRRWGALHWGWLAGVLVLGWLILPYYFISSGVYANWPEVNTADLVARLFVGVGAVGIWDELFFICTVFAVMLRHFPAWLANVLQAVVFVSFLWELGYRAWGPLLTIPFALVQGLIFLRTRSLGYVVTVHLLFDAVVFAVLVHAHNPALFDVFPTAP